MPRTKSAKQLDREIAEILAGSSTSPDAEDGPVVASIRLAGAGAPMQTREFKHRADAQTWLDQQRQVADRRGWSGYKFELTNAERKPRNHAARLGHRWKDRDHRGRRSRGGWRGTEVQSLLFSRPQWTEGKAKAWAKEHAYKSGQVDITDNYVRLRQFDPIAGRQKRTITFGDGIKAIIEQVK